MALAFERTSWRGVCVDHPSEWEIALATGPDEPPRCAFADRHYHRLDLTCREVRRPPNLELLLEKHRSSPKKDHIRDIDTLHDLAAGWTGVLRKGEGGCVTYAAKVFRDERILAEATLFWPGQRDTVLETTVLDSVAVDTGEGMRLWQAMGISLDLGSEFKLTRCDTSVGRVRWEFSTTGREGTTFTIERLAMPDRWMTDGLESWLEEQLPKGHSPTTHVPTWFNNHPARRLLSRGRADLLALLRRVRPRRVDVAWSCEAENRLYHLTATGMVRNPEDLDLPEGLVVRCCRAVPKVSAAAESRA